MQNNVRHYGSNSDFSKTTETTLLFSILLLPLGKQYIGNTSSEGWESRVGLEISIEPDHL